MLSRSEVLTKWFRTWSTLKAWNRDLSEVTLEISDLCHSTRLGTCWSLQQRIVVYRAVPAPRVNLTSELDTLLHEMAHAASIEEHHGPVWQATYARAIREVTKVIIPSRADNYKILCEAGSDAVDTWWRLSGNDFLTKMVGVS